MEHIELFFKSVFIDNMVFATFLGMCSYLARRTRIIIMPKIDQFYDMIEKEMQNLSN